MGVDGHPDENIDVTCMFLGRALINADAATFDGSPSRPRNRQASTTATASVEIGFWR